MKILQFNKFENEKMINAASKLSPTGCLSRTDNNLVYLNIDDDYIHQLYPHLQNNSIMKPDYFGKDSIGAHISVIYPEENPKISNDYFDEKHHFSIKNLYWTQLNSKKYYVLMIQSDSLIQLRNQSGLSEKPYFRGHAIDFHITVGVSFESAC
jgi:hypothetical protein